MQRLRKNYRARVTEVAAFQIRAQRMLKALCWEGDGPWRSERLSVPGWGWGWPGRGQEGGGVWWRARRRVGCSETYRLIYRFCLYMEGAGSRGGVWLHLGFEKMSLLKPDK